MFSCTEAYLIEDGKITTPVKGATLIGAGADALTRISMVGNDMALDPGVGTCGKQGQGVPVGVGQPTLAHRPPDRGRHRRMNVMRPEAVIFDMDDVLCRYDLGKRLRALSRITGQTPRDIRAAIWDSGFEDEADTGGYSDPEHLSDRVRPAASAIPSTRDDWVEARARAPCSPGPRCSTLARRIGRQARIAIYTNNGPLTKASLPELFPEAAEIFPERYYSFEFGDQEARSRELHPIDSAHMEVEPQSCWFIDDKRSNVRAPAWQGWPAIISASYDQFRTEALSLGFEHVTPRPRPSSTGSTMHHVVVMTLTGAFGLMALFMVDLVGPVLSEPAEPDRSDGGHRLCRNDRLHQSVGQHRHRASRQQRWLRRNLGAGKSERAREFATSSLLFALILSAIITIGIAAGSGALLSLLGAQGEAHAAGAGSSSGR